MKDLLRKYPEWAESCVAVIGGVAHASVVEQQAKGALVWMLGEYGQDVPDSPYILESIVEGWGEEESETVRLEILTAVAKLFFKRPPECHKLLGRTLKLGTEDSNQVGGEICWECWAFCDLETLGLRLPFGGFEIQRCETIDSRVTFWKV